jgi:hypothetical protein
VSIGTPAAEEAVMSGAVVGTSGFGVDLEVDPAVEVERAGRTGARGATGARIAMRFVFLPGEREVERMNPCP